MDLSVVVPTLNGRERLAGCLDALAEHTPDAEVVVVNGPSADGTTGMVRDRSDVDVLVEVADRTINAARNAGMDRATGDAVALVSHALQVEAGWRDALEEGLSAADVVTGPTHRKLRAGLATETAESRTIAGRAVSYFNGDNVAFGAAVLEAIDGFDEYLHTGGARDAAHRLAGLGYEVAWTEEMGARRTLEPDGGSEEAVQAHQDPPEAEAAVGTDWHWKYRALAYRLVKNYGLRPTVVRRLLGHGGADAVAQVREVVRGDGRPSSWFANGRAVLTGMAIGTKDGVVARARDRSPRRNPHGRSARADRAVSVYDWR